MCMHTHILCVFSQPHSSVHFRRVLLFATPWTAARQASLSITNSQSLLRLMSFELVMPSNHLILCHPLLLLPSISPSIMVFSNESVLRTRWPKYWRFSFSISLSKDYSGSISFQIDWTLMRLSSAVSRLLFGVEGGCRFCFVAALGLRCSTQYLHCGMWDLDPRPGIKPEPSV